MDKDKAIEIIKSAADEIPHFRTLRYDNQEFKIWRNKIKKILKAVFGENSDDYTDFVEVEMSNKDYYADRKLQEQYVHNLDSYEVLLKSILETYEITGILAASEIGQVPAPEDTAEAANLLFDKMHFHPKIVEASKSLFNTKHYPQAILEAFKAVNNFVKQKTGLSLDGRQLMAQVFSETSPIIKLNELRNMSEKDEQEGFKFLFMGAMVGIRNPKAHDNVIQTDPYRTLEYLAFASLLMKRVEEGHVT